MAGFRSGSEILEQAISLLNKRMLSSLDEKAKAEQYADYMQIFTSIPPEYVGYKNLLGLIYIEKPDMCQLSQ